MFFGLFAEVLQLSNSCCEEFQDRGVLHVAQEIELRNRQQSAGAARMTGDKNELVVAYPCWRPLQVVVQMGRLVILIDAEEGDVEVVARIFEVIGIPAEEGDVKLRREHQADIRVLLVLVKVVDLPRIKGDYVATETSSSCAILLDLRHRGALGLANVCRRHAWLHSGIDLVGDIFNSDELVEFEVGTLRFFRLGLGVEASLDVVMPFRRKLLYTGSSDVMIGEGQSVSRDEGTRSAVVESDGRE